MKKAKLEHENEKLWKLTERLLALLELVMNERVSSKECDHIWKFKPYGGTTVSGAGYWQCKKCGAAKF